MKIASLLAVWGLACASAAYAGEAPPDVLKAKGCMNCHAMETKKVGPSYKDIAAKYKDNKNAVADLTAKLKSGKGHPKVAASDDELKTALGWIVEQK